MREIRLSGSEGGARFKPWSLPLSLPPLSLVFAIPDHPWVDTAEGAAVRIAMTVGVAGDHAGELLEVTDEQPQDDGSQKVTLRAQCGKISAAGSAAASGDAAFSSAYLAPSALPN